MSHLRPKLGVPMLYVVLYLQCKDDIQATIRPKKRAIKQIDTDSDDEGPKVFVISSYLS